MLQGERNPQASQYGSVSIFARLRQQRIPFAMVIRTQLDLGRGRCNQQTRLSIAQKRASFPHHSARTCAHTDGSVQLVMRVYERLVGCACRRTYGRTLCL